MFGDNLFTLAFVRKLHQYNIEVSYSNEINDHHIRYSKQKILFKTLLPHSLIVLSNKLIKMSLLLIRYTLKHCK